METGSTGRVSASDGEVEDGFADGAASNDNGPAPAVDLDRDLFFRRMLRELSGTIEGIVGLEQATGYVAAVGSSIGDWLNAAYHANMGPEDFDLDTVAQIFVDLKNRIEGGFSIESVSADRIVLLNDSCPFGNDVVGRPSLCMMTSNVFGRIAADNLGYARVALVETIAEGDPRCRIVVHLVPLEDASADEREYYRLPERFARQPVDAAE